MEYLWGQDRNDTNARAHIYEGPFGDVKGPLCIYGYNRLNGQAFSILRNIATGPQCAICTKRHAEGLGAVLPTPHKTKYI